MTLFASLVLLLFVSAFLLAGSRRIGLPYPACLCLAGVAVGLLPGAPSVRIEPHLALALFIAPALLDAAYDTFQLYLRRHWLPLLNVAVGAVAATAAMVALAAIHLTGMPLFAAIALGAVVAPPDAAAAAAVLNRVPLPRHSSLVLQGESLLNDATALLIFGGALSFVSSGTPRDAAMELALAAPGGILLGVGAGWLYPRLTSFLAGSLSGIIIEFTATFGVWLVADALRLSPVLAVAAYGMMLARLIPSQQPARDRVHSYAVWAAAVFTLNVLAFLLMGLQAREVFAHIEPRAFWPAISFALVVLLVVVLTRMACVLGFRAVSGLLWAHYRPGWLVPPSSWGTSLLISWCGMRGLLTLATVFALPTDFPSRDLIVLAAFTVVLGTLVVQGVTLMPLMHLLGQEPDDSLKGEIGEARRRILAVGLDAARREDRTIARALRERIEAQSAIASSDHDPQGRTAYDDALARVVEAQRAALHRMRGQGAIAEDVFHRLEQELDWTELGTLPPHELEPGEA